MQMNRLTISLPNLTWRPPLCRCLHASKRLLLHSRTRQTHTISNIRFRIYLRLA